MGDRTGQISERAMRIAIGCTHRGFRGKHDVVNFLRGRGHDVEDFSRDDLSTTVDYSDVIRSLTSEHHRGQRDLVILVGRDGAGVCIAANKFRGVRAAVADDEFTAAHLRERYHCNVLCLGAEQHGPGGLVRIVASFLAARVAAGQDTRPVKELMQVEAWSGSPTACVDETILERIQR